MGLELIEVLGLRHFRRTPELENGDERWCLTRTNRVPSLGQTVETNRGLGVPENCQCA